MSVKLVSSHHWGVLFYHYLGIVFCTSPAYHTNRHYQAVYFEREELDMKNQQSAISNTAFLYNLFYKVNFDHDMNNIYNNEIWCLVKKNTTQAHVHCIMTPWEKAPSLGQEPQWLCCS